MPIKAKMSDSVIVLAKIFLKRFYLSTLHLKQPESSSFESPILTYRVSKHCSIVNIIVYSSLFQCKKNKIKTKHKEYITRIYPGDKYVGRFLSLQS